MLVSCVLLCTRDVMCGRYTCVCVCVCVCVFVCVCVCEVMHS
jgi:hypothetical protein